MQGEKALFLLISVSSQWLTASSPQLDSREKSEAVAGNSRVNPEVVQGVQTPALLKIRSRMSRKGLGERLIKIGARVIEHLARIRVELPTSCPDAALFRCVALGFMPSGP